MIFVQIFMVFEMYCILIIFLIIYSNATVTMTFYFFIKKLRQIFGFLRKWIYSKSPQDDVLNFHKQARPCFVLVLFSKCQKVKPLQ